MAQRISLRDYQRELAERLRQADSARRASWLGVQAGEARWLVDLADVEEVLPLPPVTPVPLTRPWFRGVVNVRGNLYSVVDFPAFTGGALTLTGEPRLLVFARRFRAGAAMVVSRVLGLRSRENLKRVADGSGWQRATYEDPEGTQWNVLDVGHLANDPQFLEIAA